LGISFSLLLAAAGAILMWAVNTEANGFNINTVGLILFIVGIVGALLSLAFWSSWGGFGRTHTERTIERDTVIR
jgi:hypothetical protein